MPSVRPTPLWLSHHWPEDYDRCVRIGWRHVCRRCLVLYPAAVVVMVAVAAAGLATAPASVVLLLLCPLPAVVEFMAEHRNLVRYSAARQVAVTLLLAVGLGAGFAREATDRWDPWFWGVAAVYAGLCLASVLIPGGRWDDAHAADGADS